MCADGQHIGELWEAARPIVLGQHSQVLFTYLVVIVVVEDSLEVR